ncbi:hypothetical protein [Candidatus Tisiphia endosymbiont of Oplodontha viridula]|uniref:hypothetical protein n=1 Tax=Candidatus Tisiphia endosymbiont of Oplodontha viridula TaxID=3077925 RepID=UPI0035C8F78E
MPVAAELPSSSTAQDNVTQQGTISRLGKFIWENAGKLITLGLAAQVAAGQALAVNTTQRALMLEDDLNSLAELPLVPALNSINHLFPLNRTGNPLQKTSKAMIGWQPVLEEETNLTKLENITYPVNPTINSSRHKRTVDDPFAPITPYSHTITELTAIRNALGEIDKTLSPTGSPPTNYSTRETLDGLISNIKARFSNIEKQVNSLLKEVKDLSTPGTMTENTINCERERNLTIAELKNLTSNHRTNLSDAIKDCDRRKNPIETDIRNLQDQLDGLQEEIDEQPTRYYGRVLMQCPPSGCTKVRSSKKVLNLTVPQMAELTEIAKKLRNLVKQLLPSSNDTNNNIPNEFYNLISCVKNYINHIRVQVELLKSRINTSVDAREIACETEVAKLRNNKVNREKNYDQILSKLRTECNNNVQGLEAKKPDLKKKIKKARIEACIFHIQNDNATKAFERFKELNDSTKLVDIINEAYKGDNENFEKVIKFIYELPFITASTAYKTLEESPSLNNLSYDNKIKFTYKIMESMKKPDFASASWDIRNKFTELRDKFKDDLINEWAPMIRNGNYTLAEQFVNGNKGIFQDYLHSSEVPIIIL